MKTDFASTASMSAAQPAQSAQSSSTGYSAWIELGNIYKKSGDYQHAINTYARAIAAMPDEPVKASLWNQIGEIYLQLGQPEKAVEAFRSALSVDPKHDAALLNFLNTAASLLANQPEPEAPEKQVEIAEEAPAKAETEALEDAVAEAVELLADQPVAVEQQPETGEETAPQGAEEVIPQPVAEAQPAEETSPVEEIAQPEAEEEMPVAPQAEMVADEAQETPDEAEETPPAPAVEPALPPIAELFDDVALAAGEDVLLPRSVEDGVAILPSPAPYQELDVRSIVSNPYQIREELDVDTLVESVRLYGILQPLLVTSNDDEHGIFTVISGERRLEAARQAGLESVPVVIRDADPRLRLELALTDNLSQPVNPLDLARTYQHMLAEFELTIEQLAERASVSVESISRALRLLELSEGVRRALSRGAIDIQQALALLKIQGDQAQENMLHWVLEHKLSVRETEEYVARALAETAVMDVIQQMAAAPAPEAEAAIETEQQPQAESAEELPAPVEAEEDESTAEEVELPLADTLREKLETLAEPAEAVSPDPEPILSESLPALALEPVLEAEPAPVLVEVEERPTADLVVAVAEETQVTASQAAVNDRIRVELERYRIISQSNPKNDKAWFMLGNVFFEMGKYEEAIGPYLTAVEISPNRAGYYLALGSAYAHLQRHEEAVQAFQQAVDLDPDHVYSHCALASNLRKLGRDMEAQAHLKFAAPHVKMETAYNQACFQSISGNVDRALEFLKVAVEYDGVAREILESDPDLDFIREDPRFVALLEGSAA